MKQLWFVEPGRLEWREVTAPGIESVKDALVRPLAVATCDLDVAIIDGRAPLQGPFPFWHETVAEVFETGSAETPVPLLEMYDTGVTFITGRVHARATIEPILALIAEGRFNRVWVTTETATWEEAPDALMRVTTKLVMERK